VSTKLLVFGDSWPAGAELAPGQKAFPELLKDILNIEVENLSEPATSIDHAVLQLVRILTPTNAKDYKILFCVTGYSRSLFFKDGITQELHPRNRNIESVSYYSHIYSKELAEFNLLKNILFVQSLCSQLQVPIYFIFNWSSVPNHPLINKKLFYPKSLTEILDISNLDDDLVCSVVSNHYIVPNISHPNQQGHEVIAQTLGAWIK
jgi:hypothetical protein